jgi:hypothetical protein
MATFKVKWRDMRLGLVKAVIPSIKLGKMLPSYLLEWRWRFKTRKTIWMVKTQAVIVGGFRVARTRGTTQRTQRYRTQGAVRVRSRERRSTATEDLTRQRAHRTTESDTDFTQDQGPRGEVKPLRPAFFYCTATPHEAYKVLVTEL